MKVADEVEVMGSWVDGVGDLNGVEEDGRVVGWDDEDRGWGRGGGDVMTLVWFVSFKDVVNGIDPWDVDVDLSLLKNKEIFTYNLFFI